MEVGTIGGTVESASTVVLAEKTIPIIPTPPATPSERKKTDNPREGWENGTRPPHRDFKERGVVR